VQLEQAPSVLAPCAPEYSPAPQLTHEELDAAAENVPSGQSKQVASEVEPNSIEYLPAAQSEHAAADSPEYFPARHSSQAALDADAIFGECLPAWHSIHEVVP